MERETLPRSPSRRGVSFLAAVCSSAARALSAAMLAPLAAAVVPLQIAPRARAREVTAVATFPPALGLPEVPITIAGAGFVAPAQIPAGRVLLRVTNASHDRERAADADLVRLPAGITLEDVLAYFGPAGHTATTPGPSQAWVYQATWAGGPTVRPGQTVEAVVDVSPGEWLVVDDWCGSPQQPRPLIVTERGASPGTTSGLHADVTVHLEEYAFIGLDLSVPVGPQAVADLECRPAAAVSTPRRCATGITREQALAVVPLLTNATPAAGGPDGATALDFAQPGLAVISLGQIVWLALDLVPGTYLALFLVPDAQHGISHAHPGMAQLVTVGEPQGTPPPTLRVGGQRRSCLATAVVRRPSSDGASADPSRPPLKCDPRATAAPGRYRPSPPPAARPPPPDFHRLVPARSIP